VTEVDFYVIQSPDPQQRLRIAARLADKAFHRGHRIHIHARDEEQARRLDRLLWEFRPSSFLPHGLAGTPGSERVAIGWQEETVAHDDLLINLGLGIAPFFSRFTRVAEVVTQDPGSLQALREAWRFYRDRGYSLKKHDLAVH